MRKVRVDVFYCPIVAVLFLTPFVRASGNVTAFSNLCNTHLAVTQCGLNERCYQRSEDAEPYCTCERGYTRINGSCIQEATTVVAGPTTVRPDVKHNSGGSSVAAGLLIPTFLVVIGVLLYFGARRYKWLQRFRQFRQNRYGNVLVTRDDDDDDDPPIA